MNKILFVGVIALTFTAFVVAEEFAADYNSAASKKSSGSFLHDSSSSSSSSSVHPFPQISSSSSSAPTPKECPAGTFLNGTKCSPCGEKLHCATCSTGDRCLTCPTGYTLDSHDVCEVSCATKYGEGCKKCNDKKCISCTAKACCDKMKWLFENNNCVDPSTKWPGCLETDGTKCTKCGAQTCCDKGEYFAFASAGVEAGCKPCTGAFGDKCEECVLGQCTKCKDNTIVDGSGKCKTCADMFKKGCAKCNTTHCTEAESGYTIVGTNAKECKDLFGDKCTACNTTGCSTCKDGYQLFNGYCKTCKEVFGDSCKTCNDTDCTACADDKLVLINGICSACDKAFGAGCTGCSLASGCSARTIGQYFISNRYSFSCDILPEAVKAQCKALTTRGIYFAMDDELRDDFKVTFNGQQYPVPCSNVTSHCATCSVVNEQATCTGCEQGYIHYGGECKTCKDIHKDDKCTECTVAACTKCEAPYNLSASGKCIKCDNDKQFDEETKTCMSCGDKFHECTACTSDKCTACKDNYIASDEGLCKTCMDVHGTGCQKCTKDKCETCVNDACCTNNTKIISSTSGPQCLACSYFGEKCKNCTATKCTECNDNLVVSDDSGKCMSCDQLFDGCSACDANECTKCKDSKWILTQSGCFEQKDKKTSSSSKAPIASKSKEKGGLSGGAIAGIVIACLVAVAGLGVLIFCIVTRGAKHGKIDPVIYEEDPEFISMSVL